VRARDVNSSDVVVIAINPIPTTMPDNHNDNDHDPDAPGPPISVPDTADSGEGSKLNLIVQLVKKCLGVKDIAAM
jgi:oxysterol-binding protein-related protein 9/10/11